MPAGGLGRGLSTILTGESTAPPQRGSTSDHLIERALTEMASRGPLRVCGHLDDPLGEAKLTLHSPVLASLHPTEAFQLFSALNGVDARSAGRHDLDIGSLRAMAVVVEAAGRRGLWFFGDDRLDNASLERSAQLAEAYGPAVCECRPPGLDAEPIAVDLSGSDVGWSAKVRGCGADRESEAVGVGLRPIDAAAAAIVGAVGADAVRIEVDLVAAGDTAAVVTILGLGSVLVVGAAEVGAPGDDAALAVAAATAARRAARRLTPG